MKTPEELTGWTLQIRLYRLQTILVATSPNVEKEFWVPLTLLNEKVPVHQYLDYLDIKITVACTALVDIIKADLAKQAKEQSDG